MTAEIGPSKQEVVAVAIGVLAALGAGYAVTQVEWGQPEPASSSIPGAYPPCPDGAVQVEGIDGDTMGITDSGNVCGFR